MAEKTGRCYIPQPR